MAILAVELRGVLSRSWNSKRPLVFAHVFFTKKSGVRRAREIRARISRRMDLWERGIRARLVGDAEAEGATREGRDDCRLYEEEEDIASRYHNIVLSGNPRQVIR